jgi:hypothetical protein
MSTTDAATRLRQRAAALRGFASGIAANPALDLWRRAGADTWVGPTPEACLADLQRIRADLLAAVDDLQRTASQFEQQADVLAALSDAKGPR